ncbi:hypothetical protein PFLUV_G00032430 [Perca fluviatilis]|uniref:Uncharacterized protein n=1 Tax=Perca fluviatilis TaxID=8168 RepID=A0A6A5EU50_PERFL|nr:hypothetical protein PFLUV_G00032430 [Perca fluviatilis]
MVIKLAAAESSDNSLIYNICSFLPIRLPVSVRTLRAPCQEHSMLEHRQQAAARSSHKGIIPTALRRAEETALKYSTGYKVRKIEVVSGTSHTICCLLQSESRNPDS